ncbi:lytic transglycosylase domain-containing protein [Actinocorallia sp. B10E7]|uniref:aggregation-promoting factor C-terminal-like domain-containing protein n=1 Tax=Actinocorallia sp. B10E7 TaxID=3153558 RepID=UPI00325DEF76
MPIDAPPKAWEPAGPQSPHPDVKVAGSAAAEQLDLGSRTQPKPSRIFVAGAVTALVVVVGASVFTLLSGGSDTDKESLSASVVEPTKQVPTDTPPVETVDPKAAAEQQRKELKKRAVSDARQDKVPSHTLKKGPTPEPTEPEVPAGPPVSPGTAQAVAKSMLPKFGWKADEQFGCLYQLWNRESGWRTTAGRVDGPYGIPQANPGSKMASAGPKWRTDAATQIKWGLGYVKGRYGSPCGAWAHFQANHWY